MTQRVQAKDIPDEEIIEVVRILSEDGAYCPWMKVAEAYEHVPPKVVLVKLQKLGKRGVFAESSCTCGCGSGLRLKQGVEE